MAYVLSTTVLILSSFALYRFFACLVVPHSKPNTYLKTLPLSSAHAGSIFVTQDGCLATIAKKKLRHCIRSIGS